MKQPQIPRPFIDAPLQGALRRGVDAHTLLAKSDLPINVLDAPDAGLSYPDYTRLMGRLWQLTNDEFMGLAPTTSPYGTFAMMCKAIISCSTLEHALHRAQHFYRLFPGAPSIALHKQGSNTRLEICYDAQFDPQHFLSESLLVIWHRLGSWLIGQGVPLLAVGCAYSAPIHAALYKDIFATQILFDQPSTYLLLPSKILTQAITQTPATLRAFLQHSPADLLARPNPHESNSGRIRQLLRKSPLQQLPSLEQSAQSLGVSSATLRRRLHEENTSFQQLKDEYRAEHASMLLAQQELDIRDIAEHLGFTETSTFHRAFKKWHQQTPQEFRQSLALARNS